MHAASQKFCLCINRLTVTYMGSWCIMRREILLRFLNRQLFAKWFSFNARSNAPNLMAEVGSSFPMSESPNSLHNFWYRTVWGYWVLIIKFIIKAIVHRRTIISPGTLAKGIDHERCAHGLLCQQYFIAFRSRSCSDTDESLSSEGFSRRRARCQSVVAVGTTSSSASSSGISAANTRPFHTYVFLWW